MSKVKSDSVRILMHLWFVSDCAHVRLVVDCI